MARQTRYTHSGGVSIAHPGLRRRTATVGDLTTGSGIHFADRGTHALKGVEGEWHVFAAS